MSDPSWIDHPRHVCRSCIFLIFSAFHHYWWLLTLVWLCVKGILKCKTYRGTYFLLVLAKIQSISNSTFSMNGLTDRQSDRQSDSHKNSNIEFNILTNTMTIFDELRIECDWFHFICICSFVFICIPKLRPGFAKCMKHKVTLLTPNNDFARTHCT